MPILKLEDAPEFSLNGTRIRGMASPSRGAAETMCWRVEFSSGQQLPTHAHDHEEVFHVLSGRAIVSLDEEETALGPGDTVMIPSGVSHFAYTGEGEEATFLAIMPVGTVMIRPDGERVAPPWSA
jgi:quercetin dioxygenase-like cupin family protein